MNSEHTEATADLKTLTTGGVARKDGVDLTGLRSAALRSLKTPAVAGPFDPEEFEKLVPFDKKLSPAWVTSLFEKGTPTAYRGADLKYIGMPVGGICTGQLYLGGDGRLWHWDIFNRNIRTYDGHYAHPFPATYPYAQGFAVAVNEGGTARVHRLDREDCPQVSFRGEYPIGVVDYGKIPGLPLSVKMEAFSPFIPLRLDDSSLPATMFRLTVSNQSEVEVEATLFGWMENMVCGHECLFAGKRHNRIHADGNLTVLECTVAKEEEVSRDPQPDLCFEDWNKETYEGWTVEGEAFGSGPIKKAQLPANFGDVGCDSERLVHSHASAPGETSGKRDNATGKLTSRPFVIDRDFINVWIGGGNYNGETCINLVVDGEVVRTATGYGEHRMRLHSFRVKDLRGREACLEIVDAAVEGWGHIGIGSIKFSDKPAGDLVFEELEDYGTMAFALMGQEADYATASDGESGSTGDPSRNATADLNGHLVGALGRKLRLPPGGSATVTFAITWHFPNLKAPGVGRYYATRFDSARAVADHVAANHERFYQETRLWRDTWYDSTLPWWFLDRTLANASILATSTSHRFANGNFWGWEGVGCCEGTCTHVWHYEHTMGRLFPELDINLRERTDFSTEMAFGADGAIGFRGKAGPYAVDGQAGIILRSLRDHQVSPDGTFLARNWLSIRKALEWLIQQDGAGDGILKKSQHNTLDQEWYGEVAWLSGLYLAALRAGEEMARELGDEDFATKCARIVEAGRRNLVERLFNGEYFYHTGDPEHPNTVGSYNGCEIDQVFGQSWAYQVGLGQVLPREETLSALRALWRYNFTPDVGNYRQAYKEGRWYAMAGEAGTLMCTWPQGDSQRVTTGYDYYFNECMNGFEYQLASHMIWEDMLLEGMAVTRAVHDRYDASRRNPWNEIECGDHYARSMASYGVFTAICGFEYHGPKGHIGFAPRLNPSDFRAAFTAAEGWGTFSQQAGDWRRVEIALKFGRLHVKTISLQAPAEAPETVSVFHNGRPITASFVADHGRMLVTLANTLSLSAGESLEISIR